MKYTTIDGYSVEGETYQEIVHKMRQDSKAEADTRKGFMLMISKRAYAYNESSVRISSDEYFIQDLVKGEFLLES